MNNKLYDGLNKQYSLAKTLRFELIPIGKTKDNIIKNEILKNDETRSIQYKKIKNIIDIYHKDFIDKSLCGLRLNDLDEYIVVYKKLQSTNDISLKKEIIEIKRRLRKQIAENFKSQKEFTGIFGKEIIKEYLLDYIKSKNIKDEKLEKDIKDFENFTTYFKGFHENRKNMYCEEEKSTAISYRIIDENLPIFINNMKIYKRIKENIESKDLLTLQEELSPFMMVENLDQMFELEYFNDVLGQKQIEVYNVIISGYSDSKGRKIKGLNELINLYNQRVSKENRIPKVRQLLKQILSDKIGASFVIDAINNDKELV